MLIALATIGVCSILAMTIVIFILAGYDNLPWSYFVIYLLILVIFFGIFFI